MAISIKILNLIVGINGSGKTSILTVINWVIKLSFEDLCTTKYDYIELSFEHDGKDYRIECAQADSIFTLVLNENGKNLDPITAEISVDPDKINDLDRESKEKMYERYRTLTPESGEKPAWTIIKGLPDPINVGLDRQIYLEDNERMYPEYRTRSSIRYGHQRRYKNSAIDKVDEIFDITYTKYRRDLITLNRDLRNKLLLSLFDSRELSEAANQENISISLSQIKSLEQKVKKYLKDSISSIPEQNEIDAYFNNIRSILTKTTKSKAEDASIQNLSYQISKINGLINVFSEYEKQAGSLHKGIEKYLAVVNSFLKDSYKVLSYTEDFGHLHFDAIDKDGKILAKGRSLKHLSSGEQQLVILLTYLAFNSKVGKVFIIDEPEISLHPRWQENFISSIEQLIQKSTQLVIATHSPAIVGLHRQYCIPLYPGDTVDNL